MKVIAINGSARKNGNTAHLINMVFTPLKEAGITCEMIQLSNQQISGCKACDQCYKKKNNKCVIQTDIVNDIIEKMIEADAIIFASPTYFANISSELKALIDRAGRVGRANEYLYKHKIGVAITSVRRAGSIDAFNAINNFFLIEQMIVPGSIYWNLGIGKDIGDVHKDGEGEKTMKILAENMIWLLEKITS